MRFALFGTLSNKVLWWRKMLWSWGLHMKLAITPLGKQSSEFHGIWRFITAFTRCRQLSWIWTRLIESELFNFNSLIPTSIFIVAQWMLTVLSPLFLQLMHTNYYKIIKVLKSFKIIIFAPTCFCLHKTTSGSSQPVLRQSYNVDFGYIYRYMKLSVLWLHMQPQVVSCTILP